MKPRYTQQEFDQLVSQVESRSGWDFSRMNTVRQPVPWDYIEVVKKYLKSTDVVLDIGTGGGERFAQLAGSFGRGLGTDIDPEMAKIAQANSRAAKLSFAVSSEKLENVQGNFDVILNRHAPFDAAAVLAHLKPDGYFVTQQVGEKNMGNIKKVLQQPSAKLPISKEDIAKSGLTLVAFMEYDVEYVVCDIASLVFWLNALDMLHADLPGSDALASVEILNAILAGNVDVNGFVTNEHRYLVVGQKKG